LKNKPKIVSLSIDDGPGGIANSLVTYAQACELAGIRHSLVTAAGSPATSEIIEKQLGHVFSLNKHLLKAHISSGFIANREIRKLINEADLILLHNAKLIRQMRRHKRKSWIINHSGKFRFLEKAAGVIFISERAKCRFLKNSRQPNPKVTVIPHAFPLASSPPLKRDIILPVRFIAAGRMVPKKGFSNLIEAAVRLGNRSDDFTLTIYGEGPEYTSLQSMIEAAKSDNIFLPGWTQKLDEKLKEADVFCLPSHKEPFGLVLGEAMGESLPIIAAKTDGSSQIFGFERPEERGALLYDAGDVAALAKYMEKALDMPEHFSELGQLARKTIEENFSLKKLAENLQQLITLS